MFKKVNVMKVNSYKKGICIITLQKYVIVNMYKWIGEEKMMTEAKNISENNKIIGSIVFWSVQLTVPVY